MNAIKGILKKWNSTSLIIRILIGLIIGTALGFLVPGQTWIGILGDLFVGALKAIAPILVFVLVASSLANSKGGNMSKFRTVIALYLFSTLCAAIVSVFTSFAFKITIPLVTPTLFFVVITTVISTLQIFDTIYMMLPTKSIAMKYAQSIVMYFYRNAFEYSAKGYASAIAVLLFVIIMVLTIFQMRMQKKWVHYD